MSSQAISKPSTADLYPHYKAFVHPEVSSRVNALWEAVAWWGKRMEWHLATDRFTPEQTKAFGRASAMRTQANGTTNPQEQETALFQAVRQYEKIDGNVATPDMPEEERKGKVTSIAFFMEKMRSTQTEMAERIAKKSAPFADVIKTLNTYFSPLQVTYRVTEQTEEIKIHSATEISINVAYAEKLRDLFNAGNIASLILNQVNRILVVRAIDSGKLDLQRMAKDIPHVMTFLGKALDGAKLKGWTEVSDGETAEVAPDAPEPTAKAAPTPPPPPPPPPPVDPFPGYSRRRRGFRTRSGSGSSSGTTRPAAAPNASGKYANKTSFPKGSAMAALLSFMQNHDGQTVPLSDLYASMEDTKVNAPGSRVSAMAKIGRDNGLWTLEVHKNNTATIRIHRP